MNAPIPRGPIDDVPRGVLAYPPGFNRVVVQRDAILHALRDVKLGAADLKFIAAQADRSDEPMTVVLCSLIERARDAATREATSS